MKARCTVTFRINHNEIEVQAEDQQSVLQLALDHDLEIDHSCGGFGTCGTCRVIVEKHVEKLSPLEGVELEMAQDRGFADGERLSCQIEPICGLQLRVPKKTRSMG